ncbi:MAG TPA: hypothetical protein VGD29_04425 [Actinoplanes sp.]|jgi:hypothetical protein
MNMHPVMLMMLANQRQRELVDEADRHRLLTSALEARKGRRARKGRKACAVRGQPTGNVAPCDPSAVVPAR